MTFAWNNDDVNKVLASMFAPPGENYKFIDLPLSNYASSSFDAVMSGGKVVGASMFSGYSYNERKMLSLGFVEEQYAKPGTKLTLVWGEENGGTKKTTVERHKQIEMRVEVGPDAHTASRRAKPITKAGVRPQPADRSKSPRRHSVRSSPRLSVRRPLAPYRMHSGRSARRRQMRSSAGERPQAHSATRSAFQ